MTNLLRLVLDLFFPASCLSCKQEGSCLCSVCASNIRLNGAQVCPVCKKPSLRGRTHVGKCPQKTSLSGLIVAAKYTTNPVLEKAIRQFKYYYSTELMKELGMILLEAMEKNYTAIPNTIIVPIPLHPSRKRWRGFNQAELLAREVGVQANLPVLSLLERRKKTRQQAKLSREERLENVREAFVMTRKIPPTLLNHVQARLFGNFGKGSMRTRILLIDDVASTLATLEEAAKVLRGAGVEDVTGLVLARG